MLGGSPYYVLAGVAITLSAILIARRNWSGVWVYAAFWLATLLWALWESGLDGWALTPRLAMPTALGLWMLTPWFRSEEPTSELQSLMRISYAVLCSKKNRPATTMPPHPLQYTTSPYTTNAPHSHH